MQYIKKYKLFELNYPISKYNVWDIKDYIKFVFVDIIDLGYIVNAYPGGIKDEVDTGVDFYIRRRNGRGRFADIKETLLFAIPYVEDKYEMKFKCLRFDGTAGDSFSSIEYIDDREFSIIYLIFE